MLKNYFLTALRHLYQNPLYSAINILGLTIGIACCILILTAVRYELSFDKYFSDADRIYRVGIELRPPAFRELSLRAITVFPAAKQMAVDFPDIESYTRMYGQVLSFNNAGTNFTESVYLADPDFFRIFDFHFISGDPATALSRPNSVVLTEAMAKKYFNSLNPIGKTLSVENRQDLIVTGVVEDSPKNTHFDLGIVISMNSFPGLLGEKAAQQVESNWRAAGFEHFGYIKLKPGASVTPIAEQLDRFYLRYLGENGEQFPVRLTLQPLTDIHLHPRRAEPAKDRLGHYGVTLAAIALAALVLLTACLNFVNLTSARATMRAREIAMRKILGGTARQLRWQFLMETFLLVVVAALLACALAEQLLPFFGNLIARDLSSAPKWDAASLSALALLILATTLLAGFYPALVLSRLTVTRIVSDRQLHRGNSLLQQGLTIVQFSLSGILIVLALVMTAQFHYIQQIDVGFKQDNLLVLTAMSPQLDTFRFIDEINQNYETLRTELLKNPEIESVAASAYSGLNTLTGPFNLPGKSQQEESIFLVFSSVDYDFVDVYGMTLIAGRTFSRDRAGDKGDEHHGVAILTRQGVAKLGFASPAASIGKSVTAGNKEYRIVGVVDNVRVGGGYIDSKLDILFNNSAMVGSLSLRLNDTNRAETLAYIDRTWKQLLPDYALNRFFYRETFSRYDDIFNRVIYGFITFACLAILIAGFGLYAMASFVTERRYKEIGLRKVLGASVATIVRLLLWDLSKPVVIAIATAIPTSVLIASRLLDSFPMRVSLQPGYFLLAMGCTLSIAWLTVAAHTWRVANLNPATSLRYE